MLVKKLVDFSSKKDVELKFNKTTIEWDPFIGYVVTDSHPYSWAPVHLLKYIFPKNKTKIYFFTAFFLIFLYILLKGISSIHFFILGLSYMFLESIILFNSFLLFGNPAFSAAFAVGIFLISSGIGSLLLRKNKNKNLILLLLPAASVLYSIFSLLLNKYSFSFAMSIRISFFILLVFMIGIIIGPLFPISLKRFSNKKVPFLYFSDLFGSGVASVLFSLLLLKYGIFIPMILFTLGYFIISLVLLLL